jgi:hypothetical protein
MMVQIDDRLDDGSIEWMMVQFYNGVDNVSV